MKNKSSHPGVTYLTVQSGDSGQRLDNYLIRHLKGVPKSRIYRAVRKGEVRINKKRVKVEARVCSGDQVRLPPLRQAPAPEGVHPGWEISQQIKQAVIYEDKYFLILNKPEGYAVHGGSGLNFGVIEVLRQLYPHAEQWGLAHRIDRGTSGCLVVAKRRSALRALQKHFAEGEVRKVYLALVNGRMTKRREVTLPLRKYVLQSGERMVKVDAEGKSALTLFEPLKVFEESTLVRILLKTGRTHQIRVHADAIGHPLAGDEKYAPQGLNQYWRERGLKRMFLHAAEISFRLSEEEPLVAICACLDPALKKCLHQLKRG